MTASPTGRTHAAARCRPPAPSLMLPQSVVPGMGRVASGPSREPAASSHGPPGSGATPIVAEATTDAAGRFALEGLAEGLRSVSAMAAGHHGRLLSGLAVSEGGDIGPVTIELAPVKPGEDPRMELTGIGAVLSARGDALVIGQVMPGGGAAAAGLAPGDAIVAIDGAGVVDVGFEPAIQRIRGPEGSVVILSVRKGGEGTPVEIAVRRTRVRG